MDVGALAGNASRTVVNLSYQMHGLCQYHKLLFFSMLPLLTAVPGGKKRAYVLKLKAILFDVAGKND